MDDLNELKNAFLRLIAVSVVRTVVGNLTVEFLGIKDKVNGVKEFDYKFLTSNDDYLLSIQDDWIKDFTAYADSQVRSLSGGKLFVSGVTVSKGSILVGLDINSVVTLLGGTVFLANQLLELRERLARYPRFQAAR